MLESNLPEAGIPVMTESARHVSASENVPGEDDAELYARFFKVLSDPTRLRLLALLLEAPPCGRTVSELVAALGAPQGRISTHLGCLRWCGLVRAERDGKYVYYRLSDARVRTLLTMAGTMLRDHAAGLASCGIIR
jgi:DNA-binding transcriptional ArsR family regulator